MSVLNTLGRLYGEKLIHDNLLASNVVSRSGNYRLTNTKRTPTHTRRWKKDNPNWDEKEAKWESPNISCVRLTSKWRQVMSRLEHERESTLQTNISPIGLKGYCVY